MGSFITRTISSLVFSRQSSDLLKVEGGYSFVSTAMFLSTPAPSQFRESDFILGADELLSRNRLSYTSLIPNLCLSRF